MKTDFLLLGLCLAIFSPMIASGEPQFNKGKEWLAEDNMNKKNPAPNGKEAQTIRQSGSSSGPFEVSKNATNAILVFKGEETGQGTGFVVRREIDGKQRFFIYTNQHVIAGGANLPRAYRPDGSEVTLGRLITAVGYDLAIFALSEPEEYFLELQNDVSKEVSAGDKLATPGNAGGGSTITMKFGKVVAIGPELVEIDAMIKGGNSGGPIIHENGKVIGIVSYFRQETKDDPRIAKAQMLVVRRFGYRVDNIKSWETPDWKKFASQGKRVAEVTAFSKDLIELMETGFDSWNGNEEIGKVMQTVRKNLQNARSNREAYGDLARAYTSLKELTLKDIDFLSRDSSLYWWWKHTLKSERELRVHLNEQFDQQAKEATQKR